MISLAGRDILHAWGKFVFTGLGLGLLIGVTLSMAGIYRGMVDDAEILLDNSGADLWVVQRDTLGPYAESSSLQDDLYRGILTLPGVVRAANVTYLTMQVGQGDRERRAMVVGVVPGGPGEPGQPRFLVAGRHITQGHYEAVADLATGFRLGEQIRIRRNLYSVVGLTRRAVSSGGDPMVFIPLKDAQEAQFLKDNDAIIHQRQRTLANPALNRPGQPGLLDAVLASQTVNPSVNAILVRVAPGADPDAVAAKLKTMQTDPARVRRSDPGDPDKCPVWDLHKLYSSEETLRWAENGCRTAGIGCLECKKPLIERVVEEVTGMRQRAQEYEDNPDLVRGIIAEGCEKAREVAGQTLDDVKQAMGLAYR
jgi:hypothetical protein